jgi:AcrR family transcriptional regulator
VPRGTTVRRPRTVTALLDAALELFADQGYGATSIPEICARAGLTKGAFYSNFANKEALFLALLDRSWERRAASVRRALPGIDPGVSSDDARGAGAGSGELDRQWTLVSTEFSLHAIRHAGVAALLVEHEVRVRAELAVLVAEALERAGRLPSLPVDELARMIVAVAEGSDIQVLTDRAAGASAHPAQGARAVSALLEHFSKPAGAGARRSGGAAHGRPH